jgi:hydrogenase expression/formation protein HypE
MAHGAGGSLMGKFIKESILKNLGGSANLPEVEIALEELDDSASVGGVVFSTDSYVVQPIFFPGGDIGSLAVAGTVNDLSAVGADPAAISCALILQEGFPMEELEKVLKSMSETSKLAGVPVVTGDTKVVERGAMDGIFINTSGIGFGGERLEKNIEVIRQHREFNENWIKDSNVRDGDLIIVSGTMGDHGVTILSKREGYGFESVVESDIYPLNKMISSALDVGGIAAMKDPTRGGLANSLNEWSEKSKVGILIREKDIPMTEGVMSACEMLGMDPLTIGNEGKIAIAVVREKAEEVLGALRKTEPGKKAAIIGEARGDINGVVMETLVGGKRIVDMPAGDPVPRIC